MIVQFIDYPYIYTDDGKRIHADKIEGTVRKGAILKEIKSSQKEYKVMGSDIDTDCPGGVCPIR